MLRIIQLISSRAGIQTQASSIPYLVLFPLVQWLSKYPNRLSVLYPKTFKEEKTQKGVPLQLFWVKLVFPDQLKQHRGGRERGRGEVG